VDPSGKQAFVANQGSSDVSLFSIDNQGVLSPVTTVSTGGSTPFAVALDPTGQFAYLVNEGSGDITMFTVNTGGTLGSFGSVSGRYSPGSIAFARGTSPVSRVPRFVYTANHGSNDVSAFSINPVSGALTAIGTPVSAGLGASQPFSIAADPAGKFLYVGNEASNNVSAFKIDAASGALTAVQGQPFLAGTNPNGITVDPSGRFVYTANVNSNNISVYGIDLSTGPTSGVLTAGTTKLAGTQPFSVTVDPSGRFLYAANLSSGNVSAYRIDAGTGALTEMTSSPFLLKASATPFFITVNPSGKFVYVANWISGANDTVSVLSINLNDGSLTELAASPFGAGKGSRSIAMDGAGKFVYVANEDDSTLSAYSVSPPGPQFGALNPVILSPNPFVVGGALRPIATDISGKFVYVGNYGGSVLAAYQINPSTGQLSSIGSFNTGSGVKGIAPFGITTTGTIQ
jgi:6-phosphogluconolactonase (cycloisomerase 2 family)